MSDQAIAPSDSKVEHKFVDALAPNDPRVEHKFKSFGDITYHYILAKPQGKPVATVLLTHGWPDIHFGWRYQVPYLVNLGFQVIVPDMLGYGQTSAPHSSEEYSFPKMIAQIVAIVKDHTDQPIILGGHDWGAVFAWRLVNYHPELIRAVFNLCVPYMPPSPVKHSLEDMVKKLPNFTYQLQLASGKTEEIVDKSPERLRGFLNSLFGGRTPEGDYGFKVSEGVVEENLERIGPSPLFSAETIDFYVQEFSRHGIHGPCNWYRTPGPRGEDEQELARKLGPDHKLKVPAMLVMAERDSALPPHLADGQEKYFEAGLKKELVPGSSHWVQAQCPDVVNKHIGDFIKSVLGDELKASL
ncbi:alpha/beta-hydrolase [Daldinia caldariorum]|uniref:alpha/beta-hydrolase n=1 Tax=Daldinia caldariorum TaxID=326644 RepID=UPI002008858F|nr:alpha/beta-hydrolase [Daldinia caldariorum]KAI1464993.1 alpha/beta-hydrolase [Daldinia caldariorum]